jgi:protein-disulfide isomerase
MSTEDQPPRRRRNMLLLGIEAAGLLVAIAAGIYMLVGNPGSSVEASAPERNFSVYKDDHTLGNPGAPVTVIEYAAPSCPHCARFFTTVFPTLKRNYIDTGKVYFVFRVYPLLPTDGAIEAVGRSLPKERYFGLIDHMYRTQAKWDPEYGITNVREALVASLGEAGINAAQFEKAISNSSIQDRINAVAQDGDTKYGIKAVPTFLIDGKVLENKDDIWPDMKARIDASLAKR